MIVVQKWLFDTTYILPWFGINITIQNLKENLKLVLTNYKQAIAVTTCSLIEGKWRTIRAQKREKQRAYLGRANIALQGFATGKCFEIIDPWRVPGVSILADELLMEGHQDYMDCWIAGTAKKLNLVLVSEDKGLQQLTSQITHWADFQIINWQNFLAVIE